MRKTFVFKAKNKGVQVIAKKFLIDSGYDNTEIDGKIKVFLKADGFQEMKMLVDELMGISQGLGLQLLGYID